MGLKMTLFPLLGPWAELPGAMSVLPNYIGTFPVTIYHSWLHPMVLTPTPLEPTWAENKMIKSPSIYSL